MLTTAPDFDLRFARRQSTELRASPGFELAPKADAHFVEPALARRLNNDGIRRQTFIKIGESFGQHARS